jgi:ferredoxin-NADP reductase
VGAERTAIVPTVATGPMATLKLVHILDEDQREISLESEQYNARLVRRVDETDELAYFWVRYDGDPVAFTPGQYMTIGVYADGKLVQRPYSVASPPSESADGGYEFYVRLVPVFRFTTLLWRCRSGPRCG